MSLLSPLRPILRNGNPLLKFLGNTFTGERILRRPTPLYLWATDRPRMRYPTCLPLVPGSWAYEQRGPPNEEANCDSSCRCQEDSNDEKKKTRVSDVVANGIMKVHATH